MALTPGAHLGPYEILSPLGAGGMGEVYRARDPRLGREANLLVTLGQFDEAEQEIRRAQEIEPLSLIIANSVGWASLYARRYDDALGGFRKAAELERDFIPMHFYLGCALEGLGRFDPALDPLRKDHRFEPLIRAAGLPG